MCPVSSDWHTWPMRVGNPETLSHLQSFEYALVPILRHRPSDMTSATPPLRVATQVSSSNQSPLQEPVTLISSSPAHTCSVHTGSHTRTHTHSSTPSSDAFALWMVPASSAWCCITAAFSGSHRPVITCDPVAHHKPSPPTLQKSLSLQLMASHCSACRLSCLSCKVCPVSFNTSVCQGPLLHNSPQNSSLCIGSRLTVT